MRVSIQGTYYMKLLELYILCPFLIRTCNAAVITDNENLGEEKRYPNGTVVGKYLYKDNDGNPIHLNYYADNKGYGVELKSLKINEPNTLILKSSKFEKTIDTSPNRNGSDEIMIYKNLPVVDDSRNEITHGFDLNRDLTGNSYYGHIKDIKRPEYDHYRQSKYKFPFAYNTEKTISFWDNNKRLKRA